MQPPWDFLGEPGVKNLPVNTVNMGLIPGPEDCTHVMRQLSLCAVTAETTAVCFFFKVKGNNGEYCAGYAIATPFDVVEAASLPMATSA